MIGPTRFMAFFQLALGLRVTPAGQLPKKPRSLRLPAHTGRMGITGCSGHCRVYPHGEPPATGSPSASHRVATREIVSLDHSLKDHGPTEGRKAASQATPPRRMMRASRGLIPLRPADHVLLGALFRVLPSCSAPGLLPQSPMWRFSGTHLFCLSFLTDALCPEERSLADTGLASPRTFS